MLWKATAPTSLLLAPAMALIADGFSRELMVMSCDVLQLRAAVADMPRAFSIRKKAVNGA